MDLRKEVTDYLIHNFELTKDGIKNNVNIFKQAHKELDLISFLTSIKSKINQIIHKDILSEYFSYEELKHFTWDDIVSFGEIDRSMLAYRTGGDGDWKAKGKPGDGYLLVTVSGMPYWTDAIGQIPFTLNCFRNDLRGFGNFDTAAKSTYETGIKFGDGFIFGSSDESNSYDNEMIRRGIRWARLRYKIVGTDGWNRQSIIQTTNHPPSKLSNPL